MRKIDGWACETCGMAYDGPRSEEKIVICDNCRVDMCENCESLHNLGIGRCSDCEEELKAFEEEFGS